MVEEGSEFDVIIAGGGPAGLSALLWCKELGLKAILLEKESQPGGQLPLIHNAIRNYLGAQADNGRDLRDTFLRQIENSGIQWLNEAEIVKANLVEKSLTLANGEVYTGRAIFIATGVRRRKLRVPGEDEFYGKGILESGANALNEVRGRDVLIVGGGDAALENALILSETAEKVIVVHRRNEFKARREFIDKAKRSDNIEFIFNAEVLAINGDQGVENVEIRHLSSEDRSRIAADRVLIRIGVEPNSDIFLGQITHDDAGYIQIDAKCETSLNGVFAGGDVADPTAPTISSAVGHGAIAAKAILKGFS